MNKAAPPQTKQRKAYKSPVQQKFGRVRELTAGGSAGPSEMMNTGDMMKMP